MKVMKWHFVGDTKRRQVSQTTQSEVDISHYRIPQIIMVAAFFLALSLLISSYFARNVLSLMIYVPNDGWCLNSQRGIGAHCFGDFGANIFSSGSGLDGFYGPGSLTRQYGPLNYFIFAFFRAISLILSYKISLIIYLLIMIFGLISPIVATMRQEKKSKFETYLVAFGSLSLLPVIMTIDRGNSVGLLVPFLFFYIFPRKELSRSKRLLLISTLSNIKPQLVLLILLRFRQKNWKASAEELGAVGISYFLLFFIGSPKHLLNNVIVFFHALLNYGTFDLDRQYPYNYSFAQGLHNIVSGVFGLSLSFKSTTEIALLLTALVLFSILFNRKSLSVEVAATLILPLLMLIPNLSYPYYSVVLMPLLISKKDHYSLEFPRIIGGRPTRALFSLSLMVSFLPIYIGNDMLGIANNSYNSVQIMLPGLWVLTYTFFVVSTAIQRIGVHLFK